MPDEALISQIENLLTEIIELGGANERTSIVPNLIVQDANPSGLDGFIIVSDDRDGDNIVAQKVPSITYENNDSVNVLFPKGGEAIAFQQGSQSNSGDLWEVVPGTSTDIYYNKGNVGISTDSPDYSLQIGDGAASVALAAGENIQFIGPNTASGRLILEGTAQADIILIDGGGGADDKAMQLFTEGGLTKFRSFTDAAAVQSDNIIVMDHSGGDVGIGTAGPDARLDVLDTGGPQLRLTFQDGVKFADFEVDTNDDLTISPSSTGIVLIDTSLSIDIGLQKYQLTGRGTSSLIFEAQSSGSNSIFEMFTKDGDGTDIVGIRCFAVGTVASSANRERVELIYRTAGTFDLLTEANGTGTLRPLLIYTEGNTDQIRLETDGNVGFGVASPQARIHSYGAIAGFLPCWEYDGLDATVRTVIPNGAGDVLYRLRATYVMRDSAGAVAGATANVNNGASTNLTVGTNTVRLRVNADGSCDVARTAGTDTIKITLMLNS
jgi:hypothetical protein